MIPPQPTPWLSSAHQLSLKLNEHCILVCITIVISTIVGISVALMMQHFTRSRNTVLRIAKILQTIPSLAVLALCIPLLGIGTVPAVLTLVLYALLPIIKNTHLALQRIPPHLLDAAHALGMTPWQTITKVKLPIALPYIINGIRLASSMTIGLATIAAFVGAGGLGDFITNGLALNDHRLILLGAVPAGALALSVDYLFEYGYQNFIPHIKRNNAPKLAHTLTFITIICLLTINACLIMGITAEEKNNRTITIACKNFTEQIILGYIITDLIEKNTSIKVIKKFDLGSTAVIHDAIQKGQVDLYPEYAGTAYSVILKKTQRLNEEATRSLVKKIYKNKFHLTWIGPLGFNSNQTLAIHTQLAKQMHILTLSDLARISPRLSIAAPNAFLARPDGYPLLKSRYGFHFHSVHAIAPYLIYPTIAHHLVDCIGTSSTDGRLQAYSLTTLLDDRRAYPNYSAGIVIRTNTLKQFPELLPLLKRLLGTISNKTMTYMNYIVDTKKESAKKVAERFLLQHGMIKRE